MEAISPFTDAATLGLEVKIAEHQPEYSTLPAFFTRLGLLTRWHFTDEERRQIANGADLFIGILNFGQAVQPLMPMIGTPEEALSDFLAEEQRLTPES